MTHILHNLCFSFLLSITAVPGEIENSGVWGRCDVKGVGYVYVFEYLPSALQMNII